MNANSRLKSNSLQQVLNTCFRPFGGSLVDSEVTCGVDSHQITAETEERRGPLRETAIATNAGQKTQQRLDEKLLSVFTPKKHLFNFSSFLSLFPQKSFIVIILVGKPYFEEKIPTFFGIFLQKGPYFLYYPYDFTLNRHFSSRNAPRSLKNPYS